MSENREISVHSTGTVNGTAWHLRNLQEGLTIRKIIHIITGKKGSLTQGPTGGGLKVTGSQEEQPLTGTNRWRFKGHWLTRRAASHRDQQVEV